MNNGQVPDLGNPSLGQAAQQQHYPGQNHTPNGAAISHQPLPSQPPSFPNNFNMNNMQIPPGMDHETLRRQLAALRDSQLQRRVSGSNTPGSMASNPMNGMQMGMNMGMSPGGGAGQGQGMQNQSGQGMQGQGQGNFQQLTEQQQADKQRQLAIMMQQLQHQRLQQQAYARQQQAMVQAQTMQGQAMQGQAMQGQAMQGQAMQGQAMQGQGSQDRPQSRGQPQSSPFNQQNPNHGQQRPITPSTKPPIGIPEQSPLRHTPQSQPSIPPVQKPFPEQQQPANPRAPPKDFTPSRQFSGSTGFPSAPPSASTSTFSRPHDAPPPAKRARYKVEYHPLVREITTAGGWDLHTLDVAREKQSRYHKNLEVEDLGAIDIEGLCMSLRSGLNHEVSYALTALAMLSMPGKGNDKGGLGLAHCGELLSDLVDLVELNAFGERGWKGWSESVDRDSVEPKGEDQLPASVSDSARHQRPKETAWKLESPPTGYQPNLAHQSASALRQAAEVEARSYTCLFDSGVSRKIGRSKKRVETVLVAINLLRNFSMMSDNFVPMTQYDDLMECLMRVCDVRLAKVPEQEAISDDDPAVFTLMDLLRIRHDTLDTVLNLAHDLDLSRLSAYAQRAIFDLLNSYILDIPVTNASHRFTDVLFSNSARLVPSRTEWAVEALTRITTRDCNRRCLWQLPSDKIVSSFQTLLRYLPLSIKDSYSINATYATASEILLRVVFCLYSLAWLSPLPTRTQLRETTDAVPVLSLAARRLMTLKPHPTSTIILRRLMATLGVLNGASDELVDDGPSITFGANASVRGLNGWNDTKHCVQPGLLAGHEDLLTDMVMLASAQGVQLDAMTLDELEKAIWVKNSP
jgi:hypothetical protein